MDLIIVSEKHNSDDLIGILENIPGWPSQDIELLLRKKEQPFRTIDPVVVVAIISAASAGLGVLIKGIFDIALENKSKIIIQDKDGRKLEFPADYPSEKMQELLQLVRRMEGVKIVIPDTIVAESTKGTKDKNKKKPL